MPIWVDKALRLTLKLRLLVAGVLSILCYGFESWFFTGRLAAKLKAWMARALAHLTGRTVEDEYRVPTVDLVLWLRMRRLRWLGHVLRQPEQRLTRRVVLALHSEQLERCGAPDPEGVLMDAPAHRTVDELVALAEDKDGWRAWRFELCDKLSLKSPVQWNGTGVASELFRKPGGGSTALSKQALLPKGPRLHHQARGEYVPEEDRRVQDRDW